MRPHLGATLTLRAWYLFPWHRCRYLPRATHALKEALGDCVFFACLPWQAGHFTPGPFLCPVFCADAAKMGDGYQVGIFNPTLGIRTLTCPPSVRTRQQFYAVDASLRLATCLGYDAIGFVGDNQAALHLLLSLRPTLSNQSITTTARRVRNRLLWTGLLVHAVWCPSGVQPADPASRCDISNPAELAALPFHCSSRWESLLAASEALRIMGSVQLRHPHE